MRLSRVTKKPMVSLVFLETYGSIPELPIFGYSDRNYFIHLTNLHRKSLKITNKNLIPCGFSYSQIQNFRTAQIMKPNNE
jgi:hypothetical protein